MAKHTQEHAEHDTGLVPTAYFEDFEVAFAGGPAVMFTALPGATQRALVSLAVDRGEAVRATNARTPARKEYAAEHGITENITKTVTDKVLAPVYWEDGAPKADQWEAWQDALRAAFYRDCIEGKLGMIAPSETRDTKDRKEAGKRLLVALVDELNERNAAKGKALVNAFQGKGKNKEENEKIEAANEQHLATFIRDVHDAEHKHSQHKGRFDAMLEAVRSERKAKANGAAQQVVTLDDLADL